VSWKKFNDLIDKTKSIPFIEDERDYKEWFESQIKKAPQNAKLMENLNRIRKVPSEVEISDVVPKVDRGQEINNCYIEPK